MTSSPIFQYINYDANAFGSNDCSRLYDVQLNIMVTKTLNTHVMYNIFHDTCSGTKLHYTIFYRKFN